MPLARNTYTKKTLVPCFAPLPFSHKMVRHAIHALKYYRYEKACTLFARAMAIPFCEEIAEKRMFGTFTQPILIPLPLHAKKLHERGFNQTFLIAQALLQELQDTSISLSQTALTRVRASSSQTKTKGPQERLAHVQGAFFAQRKEVLGKDVIILDDVITTGATLKSASETLKEAGARSVWCIAVAQ